MNITNWTVWVTKRKEYTKLGGYERKGVVIWKEIREMKMTIHILRSFQRTNFRSLPFPPQGQEERDRDTEAQVEKDSVSMSP